MCKTPASIVHLARDVCLPGRQLNGSAAHSPADVLRAIKAAKKTMQAALTQLSSDLYTQECRWLLELLQNADDNEYEPQPEPTAGAGAGAGAEAGQGGWVEPRVDIVVGEYGLRLSNNERGFTERDVEALCDIGASTKKAADARERQTIGEKGIGFKSVFAISERPHVRSNYFSFMFEKDSAHGMGCLVPRWVAAEDFPHPEPCRSEERTEAARHAGTCIVLPVPSAGSGRSSLEGMWATVRALDPLLLLFLRQLRVLTVSRCYPPRSGQRREYRRELRKHGSGADITIVDTTDAGSEPGAEPSAGSEAARQTAMKFKMHQYVAAVPSHVRQDLAASGNASGRETHTEISCAFPLNPDGSADASRLHSLFVFLPTRPYGLRFPLHARFLVPSSREEVLRGGLWNVWLAEEVAEAIVGAAETVFRHADAPLRETWYRFIPRRVDLADEFFLKAHGRTIARLKQLKCIATEGGGWARPSRVVLRSDAQLGRLISNDVLRAALGKEYAAEGLDDGCGGETLAVLGCARLSHKILQKCLRHRSFVADMRTRDDSWLLELYSVLERHASSTKWLSMMQQIPLVRLADGTHCCALRDAEAGAVHEGAADTRLTFFPSLALEQWMLAPSLNLVRAATIGNGAAAEIDDGDGGDHSPAVRLLMKLGVCVVSPSVIIQRYILPFHRLKRGPAALSQEDALLLCIQASYAKQHLDSYLRATENPDAALQQLGDELLLRRSDPSGAKATFVGAASLYLPSVFCEAGSPKLESVLRNDPSVSMVDACYLATDPPDLVAASDAESRRDAWRSFLLRIGCRIVPAVTAKSFVLNGAQALNQLNVHARSVQVHDWVLSPEFRRVLAAQQHDSLGALLSLMDLHWTETYGQRQCVLEYQSRGLKRIERVPASFIREIRDTMHVPTSLGEMRPMRLVSCRTAELVDLFGEGCIPFVSPELSCAEMKQALGITGVIDTELALCVLRTERARAAAGGALDTAAVAALHARVSAAYEILMQRFRQDSALIRGAFETDSLLCIPDASPRFLSAAQVCWSSGEAVFGTQHGFLEPHYAERGLESFFCGKLGVLQHLPMRDIADRLMELSIAHSGAPRNGMDEGMDEGVQNLALKLYSRLNHWLAFANGDAEPVRIDGAAPDWPTAVALDWQCMEHLRSQPVFLSRAGTFCRSEQVLVPDDAHLEVLFGAVAGGCLFSVASSESDVMRHLLEYFGLRYDITISPLLSVAFPAQCADVAAGRSRSVSPPLPRSAQKALGRKTRRGRRSARLAWRRLRSTLSTASPRLLRGWCKAVSWGVSRSDWRCIAAREICACATR